MKKAFMTMTLILVVSLLATSVVIAGEFPERSPTCVVGYGAGGGTDTAIRPIIAEMEKYFGRPITVVNMPGGSSAVAAEYVIQRPADGYWWYGTGSNQVAVSHRVMGYVDHNWRDWETLVGMTGPDGVIVRSDSGIETVDALIEQIKAEETVWAVTGVGGGNQLTFDELADAVGAKEITWVPYEACHECGVEIIKGDIKYASVTLSAVWDFVRSGDLKVLLCWGRTEPLEVHRADGSTYTAPNIGSVDPELEYLDGILKAWPIFVRRDVPIEKRDKIREAFIWACEQPSVSKAAEKVGLQLTPMVGEKADRAMSLLASGEGWLLWESGQGEISPEEFGIPRTEDWSWPPEDWDMSQYPMKGE